MQGVNFHESPACSATKTMQFLARQRHILGGNHQQPPAQQRPPKFPTEISKVKECTATHPTLRGQSPTARTWLAMQIDQYRYE